MAGYWQERNIPYNPGQKKPFKVSRSKIELFMQCRRCFWLDVRHKITRPSTPPFNINKAIDELFKKEFDFYREKQQPHPLMVAENVKAVPMQHPELDTWRDTFKGVSIVHEPTNLHVFGGIDDIWLGDDGKAIVVDYKATSKDKPVSLDSDWQISYKRQVEIYQWLLRANNIKMSDMTYFVYANGRIDADGFYDKLEFITKLLPYKGNDSWVNKTIMDMKKCMDGDIPPVGQSAMGGDCDYCAYARSRTELTLQAVRSSR